MKVNSERGGEVAFVTSTPNRGEWHIQGRSCHYPFDERQSEKEGIIEVN
jgi:hypothetical protein